jgi:hypothetical protein
VYVCACVCVVCGALALGRPRPLGGHLLLLLLRPAAAAAACGTRYAARLSRLAARGGCHVPLGAGRQQQQQQQVLRGTWQWQPSSGGVLKCHPAPLRALSWPFVKDQARSRSGCEAGGEVHFFLGFYLRRRRLAQQTRRWWSSFFRMTGIKRSRLARI